MAKITDSAKAKRYAQAIVEDVMLYNMEDFKKMKGKNYLNSKKIRSLYDEGLRLFNERISPELEDEDIFFKVLKKRVQKEFGEDIKWKLKPM
jgi:hypothetical protein